MTSDEFHEWSIRMGSRTLLVILVAWPISQHVVWYVGGVDRTVSATALLVVGLVVPVIGWVHGVSIMLGWAWI